MIASGAMFVGTAIWKLLLNVESETCGIKTNAVRLLGNGFVAVEDGGIEQAIEWCDVVNEVLSSN